MSAKNAPLKAETIEDINGIFNAILTDLRCSPSHSATQNMTEYEIYLKKIKEYQAALIHEVNSRKASFDHPIRAARALEKLNFGSLDQFQDNLNNFKYHSQHSGLYPNTRKVASALTSWAFLVGSIALCIFLSPWFTLLVIPAYLTAIKTPAINSRAYLDVYAVKSKSEPVANFYSLFRNDPPPPVVSHPSAPLEEVTILRPEASLRSSS